MCILSVLFGLRIVICAFRNLAIQYAYWVQSIALSLKKTDIGIRISQEPNNERLTHDTPLAASNGRLQKVIGNQPEKIWQECTYLAIRSLLPGKSQALCNLSLQLQLLQPKAIKVRTHSQTNIPQHNRHALFERYLERQQGRHRLL